MGIGEKLREARERHNITLEDLQATTKIQKRYLRAIEEGNFHILPGSFYARAFIKEYANAVGLNPEELLEAHADELPSIGEKRSGAQYTRLQRTRKSSEPSRASAILSFLPTVIVILLVIGIITLAIYLYQQKTSVPSFDNEPGETDEFYRKGDGSDVQNEESENNNINNENDENDGNEEPEEEVVEQVEAELVLVETGAGTVPESIYDFVHDEDEIELTIEANSESWLGIENQDNESLYSSMITGDSPRIELNITEEEVIILNIGHAPGVEVKINDVLMEYPVDENDRVHQKITINIKQNE